MPGRKHPLINTGIYHVYNKTIEGKKILINNNICQRLLDLIQYYRSSQSILRFSKFQKLTEVFKNSYERRIFDKRAFRISILSYCLMPTHYHFLLKQNIKNGISIFISQIQNSFTKYYNTKNKRIGPIFLHRFKSKPIQSEEQLKHVSRYIHLNPYSDGLVSNDNDLMHYPWSSFHDYVSETKEQICETEYFISLFNNKRERYKKFVLDNAEHQKMLEYCKHTNKW